MKNAGQLITDMLEDKDLSVKFREGLNRLRGDKTLDFVDACVLVAGEQGYELSMDEVKDIQSVMRGETSGIGIELSEEALEAIAGGSLENDLYRAFYC